MYSIDTTKISCDTLGHLDQVAHHRVIYGTPPSLVELRLHDTRFPKVSQGDDIKRRRDETKIKLMIHDEDEARARRVRQAFVVAARGGPTGLILSIILFYDE